MFGPAKASKTRNDNINRSEDKYYTKKDVAIRCVEILKEKLGEKSLTWVEPSVGSGAFRTAFDYVIRGGGKFISLDIDANVRTDFCCDYLNWKPKFEIGQQVIVFGNPPFGKNSSLAVKFINKSAEFADFVAFILPMSFEKASIMNRISQKLHLVYSENVGENAFEFEGKDRDVPCKFYIFEKRPTNREMINPGQSSSQLVTFVSPKDCTLMIQRVGSKAGKCVFNRDKILEKAASRNFYFCKIDESILTDEQRICLSDMDLSECKEKQNTSGMPSISRPECVKLIHKFLKIEIK